MGQKNVSKSYNSIVRNDRLTTDVGWDLVVQLLHDRLEKELGPERIKNLNFHVESDDYFGTIATVINLILQDSSKDDKYRLTVLGRLRDDLMFLQRNYKIIKKKKE